MPEPSEFDFPADEADFHPVGALDLPNYPLASLSNRDTRSVYANGELRMWQLHQRLVDEGMVVEDRARRMCRYRNALRLWTRMLMKDRDGAAALATYEPNRTFEQLEARQRAKGLAGDAIYEAIIESSTRSRPDVNDSLGIDPEAPPPLPPLPPQDDDPKTEED